MPRRAASLRAWIIAGPVSRYPASGSDHGFSAAWLGEAPFAAPAEMAWASRLYSYLGKSFRYLDPPPPYRVFMRFLPATPGGGGIGGTALPRSFMLSATASAPKLGATAPHGTLAHELTHQWVGGIAEPDGINSWFSEGLTTYFSALIPKRGGFATLDDWSREINRITASYYAFPARSWSAAKIAEARGSATRTSATSPMAARPSTSPTSTRRSAPGPTERAGWRMSCSRIFKSRERRARASTTPPGRRSSTKELGPEARAAQRWRRTVIDGELFTPGEHAFGPCFERASPRPSHSTARAWTATSGCASRASPTRNVPGPGEGDLRSMTARCAAQATKGR